MNCAITRIAPPYSFSRLTSTVSGDRSLRALGYSRWAGSCRHGPDKEDRAAGLLDDLHLHDSESKSGAPASKTQRSLFARAIEQFDRPASLDFSKRIVRPIFGRTRREHPPSTECAFGAIRAPLAVSAEPRGASLDRLVQADQNRDLAAGDGRPVGRTATSGWVTRISMSRMSEIVSVFAALRTKIALSSTSGNGVFSSRARASSPPPRQDDKHANNREQRCPARPDYRCIGKNETHGFIPH